MIKIFYHTNIDAYQYLLEGVYDAEYRPMLGDRIKKKGQNLPALEVDGSSYPKNESLRNRDSKR
jgi:hypothetical protein